jgi:hypothetical protein
MEYASALMAGSHEFQEEAHAIEDLVERNHLRLASASGAACDPEF